MGNLTILHGVRTVQLTQGYNALVDEVDYPSLVGYPWRARVRGPRRYALCGGSSRPTLFMHNLILRKQQGVLCDHRNSDGTDNRRSNLRECSSVQNSRNRRKAVGASRFKGVQNLGPRYKNRPWQARIQGDDGRQVSIGTFVTEIEAALAYDAKAMELFGEFACTNAEILGEVFAR